MSLSKTYSAQLTGLVSEIITIEVDISNGLHSFSVVGLGDRSVEEAKDRIAAAIKNSGFVSPKQKNQKVVISLAPADIRKEGPSFDLGMALGYLTAAGDVEFLPDKKLFLGELSLEGRLRRINGILPILCQAKDYGFTEIFIPLENAEEASLAQGVTVYPAARLIEVINHLKGTSLIEPNEIVCVLDEVGSKNGSDISMVRGNETAKRGLEIAAAGAHNIILCGPPGTGKTMLAQCFSSILPNLTYEQAIEVTSIHSAAKVLERGLIFQPPFRSPHHTASYPAIVGGGSLPKPGEITLAHRGVLFLDEFPEFDRDVIESLRQPLEDRLITISRIRGAITFPAQCILIASMNPCPCGKGKGNGCTCTVRAIESYKHKMSGPVMDRLDIWINVNKVDYEQLGAKASTAESSQTVKKRVTEARHVQRERFAAFGISKYFNGEMNAKDIEEVAVIEDEARAILQSSAERLELSGRAFHRIIKVSQTIADLAKCPTIKKEHVLEALQYRQKME